MLASSDNSPRPKVSIILPTYNRAKFLPQAFASIRAQTWTDWELIIVDDGSTDDTQEILPELSVQIAQSVRYFQQENKGPYGARNTGLDHTRGQYIAFFDSDDVWLPHHLQDCVGALEAKPELDCVYGACQIVEHSTGKTLSPSTFYLNGQPRPFLKLKAEPFGRLKIIEDSGATGCQILHGLFCGLQNSVINRRVFENYRFATHLRNEAEDQVIVIRSLAAGFRFAYFDHVHVIYNVHGENSSAALVDSDVKKKLNVFSAMVRGFEEMEATTCLRYREKRALRHRIGNIYFWQIGWVLRQGHHSREALQMYRRGLSYYPWDYRYWKTYFTTLIRSVFLSKREFKAAL
jgi:glycosyltransferase involved in cell wall biosynthesis